MAAWPELDELKQVLDVREEDVQWDGDEDYELTRLSSALAAAIARVKKDVGNWDEYEDVPDEMLARAALRMAELIATRPSGPTTDIHDLTYNRLLFGHRRVFAIA